MQTPINSLNGRAIFILKVIAVLVTLFLAGAGVVFGYGSLVARVDDNTKEVQRLRETTVSRELIEAQHNQTMNKLEEIEREISELRRSLNSQE